MNEIANRTGSAKDITAASVIARARARRPELATVAAAHAFALLADRFPKSERLLTAAASLPGVAGAYRWRETARGASLDAVDDALASLIGFELTPAGQIILVAGSNAVTHGSDGAAAAALAIALPEILAPHVAMTGTAEGAAASQILKQSRRIRRQALAARESLERTAAELRRLAGPFASTLDLLTKRGFRLPNGRPLQLSIVAAPENKGQKSAAVVLELVAGGKGETIVLSRATFDGKTLAGDRAIGDAWRASSFDPAGAKAIFALSTFEPAPVDRAEAPLDARLPLVLAEAAVACGLAAPEAKIDDPALLARVPQALRAVFARAIDHARTRRDNMRQRRALHVHFNRLMQPLIDDCVALAQASLVDPRSGEPFLFELESADPAPVTDATTLPEFLNPIGLPTLRIQAGRKLLVIRAATSETLSYATAIVNAPAELPDTVPATPKEARSLRRLALHLVDSQEMVSDPLASVFGEVPDEAEAQALTLITASAQGVSTGPARACVEKRWIETVGKAGRLTRHGRAALALYRARRATGATARRSSDGDQESRG